MLHITDLKDEKKQKCKLNHEIYKELLQDVNKRIMRNNKKGTNFVCFYVPIFIIGKPLFNYEHALLYITRKLQKGGFIYEISNGNKLNISW